MYSFLYYIYNKINSFIEYLENNLDNHHNF
jgi:hypothetical protein